MTASPFRNVILRLREEMRFLRLVLADRRVPWLARVVILLALAYLLFPTDLIPDRIPVLGYTDDVSFLWLGSLIARRLTPATLLDGASAGAEELADEVWVLADDRIGNTNQSLGVAERLGLPVRVHRIRYDNLVRLPNLLRGGSLIGLTAETAEGLRAPWPRLVIGTGRRVAPAARFVKMMSGGRSRTVQMMDPEAGREGFDLVAIPNHDRSVKDAPNLLRTTGAPNRMNPARLAAEAEAWRPVVAHLPHPRVALLLGGDTRFFDFGAAMADDLGELLSLATARLGGSLLLTTSRRTPPATADALVARICAPAYVHRWAEEGANPFFGFLGLADYVVVTGDSMSMCTEACQSGKPVYIYAPPGGMTSAKYRRLHEELFAIGAARPFTGELAAGWQKPMDNPTELVAEAARRLLQA